MLEFDDIQHILLTRAPALTGRYEFLSFHSAAAARRWLSAITDKVHSAQAMRDSVDQEKRWVTVAFTWNGLRALGVEEASLATFPEEFKQKLWATQEQIILTTGRTRRRARISTPSSFCSLATNRSASGARRSMRNLLRSAKA